MNAEEAYVERSLYGVVTQLFVKDEGAKQFGGTGVDIDGWDIDDPMKMSKELSDTWHKADVDGYWFDSSLSDRYPITMFEVKSQLKSFDTMDTYFFEMIANNEREDGKYVLGTGVMGSALRSEADWLCCVNFVGRYNQKTGEKAGFIVDWNNPLFHPDYWLLINLPELRDWMIKRKDELKPVLFGRNQGYEFTVEDLKQQNIPYKVIPFNHNYDFENLAKKIRVKLEN